MVTHLEGVESGFFGLLRLTHQLAHRKCFCEQFRPISITLYSRALVWSSHVLGLFKFSGTIREQTIRPVCPLGSSPLMSHTQELGR